jgi:hypothetical protein
VKISARRVSTGVFLTGDSASLEKVRRQKKFFIQTSYPMIF